MTFEEIYSQFCKKVYNLALHFLQHSEDAQDVTQEVFVSIYSSLHQFENRSSLSTWIHRITVNKCLDKLRQKKRNRKLGALFSYLGFEKTTQLQEQKNFEHPGVLAEEKEGMRRVFDCINALPDHYKSVIILCKVMNYSQVETAEIMKTTPKAIESMLQRAKVALQKKLDLEEGKRN